MSKPPQQPPFPNKYHVKLVASLDSKACLICYKPATTVLLADGNGDFFYTCPQHLLDNQFANAIHPQEYTELLDKNRHSRTRNQNWRKMLSRKNHIFGTLWQDIGNRRIKIKTRARIRIRINIQSRNMKIETRIGRCYKRIRRNK